MPLFANIYRLIERLAQHEERKDDNGIKLVTRVIKQRPPDDQDRKALAKNKKAQQASRELRSIILGGRPIDGDRLHKVVKQLMEATPPHTVEPITSQTMGTVHNINSFSELVDYINTCIGLTEHGVEREEAGYAIVQLLANDKANAWYKEVPLFQQIFDVAADLELYGFYRPTDELWDELQTLARELNVRENTGKK